MPTTITCGANAPTPGANDDLYVILVVLTAFVCWILLKGDS